MRGWVVLIVLNRLRIFWLQILQSRRLHLDQTVTGYAFGAYGWRFAVGARS